MTPRMPNGLTGLDAQMLLEQRSATRQQAYDQHAQEQREGQMINPSGGYSGGPSPVALMGGPRMDPQWGAFFEGLKESNATIASRSKGVDPLPGLPTDTTGMQSPSLDGLKTGRALELQQRDQANARQTALDIPADSGTGIDRTLNTALTKLRATPKGY